MYHWLKTVGKIYIIMYHIQYSLAMALEEMGFPTLHTQHLYENHALFDMWNQEVFLPSMAAGKTIMGKPDLSLIASFGYQGTADLPMALYFEQVMEGACVVKNMLCYMYAVLVVVYFCH
jgi:hypothetical protein